MGRSTPTPVGALLVNSHIETLIDSVTELDVPLLLAWCLLGDGVESLLQCGEREKVPWYGG